MKASVWNSRNLCLVLKLKNPISKHLCNPKKNGDTPMSILNDKSRSFTTFTLPITQTPTHNPILPYSESHLYPTNHILLSPHDPFHLRRSQIRSLRPVHTSRRRNRGVNRWYGASGLQHRNRTFRGPLPDQTSRVRQEQRSCSRLS